MAPAVHAQMIHLENLPEFTESKLRVSLFTFFLEVLYAI